ncbi:hypothetical protein [Bradyrhizobium sp.]|uniref:hypothetical protein n=1 Tax=Bradyrhizobium sp. TaxID=376 RepID=UPI002D60B119|nr:hypothetical protein [Bradyrhizobium sp.]HZR72594.1 hypothetical protein [Bradyrhizobium sp.]
MMNFASSNSIGQSRIKAPTFNATILLVGTALFILFALAFYLASGTPGTTLDELAFMTVAP